MHQIGRSVGIADVITCDKLLVIDWWVSILYGVEDLHFPLTKPVAVNTGLALRAARDDSCFIARQYFLDIWCKHRNFVQQYCRTSSCAACWRALEWSWRCGWRTKMLVTTTTLMDSFGCWDWLRQEASPGLRGPPSLYMEFVHATRRRWWPFIIYLPWQSVFHSWLSSSASSLSVTFTFVLSCL